MRAALSQLLTAMEGVPAYIWGRRTDVLAWNRTASAVFGDWAARAPHDVKRKSHGSLRLMHPLVGEFTVRYETFALTTGQELALSTYHAEPGSALEQALRLVASWGADAALVTGK